jgi:hypothetical protein
MRAAAAFALLAAAVAVLVYAENVVLCLTLVAFALAVTFAGD